MNEVLERIAAALEAYNAQQRRDAEPIRFDAKTVIPRRSVACIKVGQNDEVFVWTTPTQTGWFQLNPKVTLADAEAYLAGTVKFPAKAPKAKA